MKNHEILNFILRKTFRGDKVYLAKFCTGNHNFQIEVGRHQNVALENRICKFCMESKGIRAVEDEFHVLLECNLYKDVRDWYLKKHYNGTDEHSFILLMKSHNKDCMLQISLLVYSRYESLHCNILFSSFISDDNRK